MSEWGERKVEGRKNPKHKFKLKFIQTSTQHERKIKLVISLAYVRLGSLGKRDNRVIPFFLFFFSLFYFLHISFFIYCSCFRIIFLRRVIVYRIKFLYTHAHAHAHKYHLIWFNGVDNEHWVSIVSVKMQTLTINLMLLLLLLVFRHRKHRTEEPESVRKRVRTENQIRHCVLVQ